MVLVTSSDAFLGERDEQTSLAHRRILRSAGIHELAQSRPAFEYLQRSTIFLDHLATPYRSTGARDGIFVVAAGCAGLGKSSTLNALVGFKTFKESSVDAGTHEIQAVDFRLRAGEDRFISFVDLPGMGERLGADDKYRKLHQIALTSATVILYFVRVDQRNFSYDETIFSSVIDPRRLRDRLIIVLSAIDLAAPLNRGPVQPLTLDQWQYVALRRAQVRTSLGVERIVPVSARLGTGLDDLALKMQPLIKWPDGPLM